MMICANRDTPLGDVNLQVQERAEYHHLSVLVGPHTYPADYGAKTDRLQLLDCQQEQQSMKELDPSLDSPILRLPPEVTSEIFILCLPERDHDGFLPEPSLDTAPLSLGRVCSQWRVIAWSIPSLWSSLSLRLYHERLDLDAWLIESWLARSGQCPLLLSFRCSNVQEDDGWESQSASLILEAIIPHSHRWEQVDFLLPIADFDSLSAVICELPLLKRLKIGRTCYPDFLDEVIVDVFSNTPRLQDAALTGCDPSVFPLPWGQLVRLWAKDLFVGECLEILQQSAKLVECAFLALAGLGYNHHSLTLRLEQLSSLKVSGAGVHVGMLLDCLTLPGLQSLEVEGNAGAWRDMNVLSIMTRSSCVLQSVSLNRIRFAGGEVAEFLRHVPSLVELKVYSCSTLDDFLLHLTAPSMRQGYLQTLAPRLRDISLRGQSLSLRTLVTMLSSRWKTEDTIGQENDGSHTIASLRSCHITLTGLGIPNNSEAVSQLQAMAEEGLMLQIEPIELILP